jgi:hypothetical protein
MVFDSRFFESKFSIFVKHGGELELLCSLGKIPCSDTLESSFLPRPFLALAVTDDLRRAE